MIHFAEQRTVLRVEHDEARGIGCWDVGVGPVHAIAGWNEDLVPDDKRITGGGVVLEHAEFLVHVVYPENIAVRGAGFDRYGFAIRSWSSHELGFLFLGHSLVAVGHAVHVESDDLTAVARNVANFPNNGGRG